MAAAAASSPAAINYPTLGQGVNVVMTAAGALLVAVGFIAFGLWLCGRASVQSSRVSQQVEVVKRGLSKEAINRIPITNSVANPLKDECCAICLGEFEGKVRILPDCRHAFHAQCIDQWLFTNKTCPTCRKDLSGLEEQPQRDLSVVVVTDRSESSGVEEQQQQQQRDLSEAVVSDRSDSSGIEDEQQQQQRDLSLVVISVDSG